MLLIILMHLVLMSLKITMQEAISTKIITLLSRELVILRSNSNNQLQRIEISMRSCRKAKESLIKQDRQLREMEIVLI